MEQIIKTGQQARHALLDGINITNDIVKVTLGPQGKNVVSNKKFGGLWTSKDGIKVIREIDLSDQFQNAGVKLIREASRQTADSAGDATTTTCILAAAIINKANQLINEGHSSIKLRQQIEETAFKATDWIKKNTTTIKAEDVEKVRQIATISANNNTEVGDLIASAFSQIGMDGQIDLQKSKKDKNEMEILGGFYFQKGMAHPYFINNPVKMECELVNPLILLYDKVISKANDILPALQYAASNGHSLLIMASAVEGEAMATVLKNLEAGAIKACVVQNPDQGSRRMDLMTDLAVFSGGEVIADHLGRTMDDFNPDWLGAATKAIIGRNKTVIVNGQGNPDKIQAKADEIKAGIPEAVSDFEKEYLRNRAASIGKGVAILHIGAATELEQDDKFDLAEDSILAVRSALEEGYLPGGGISYLKCAYDIADPKDKTPNVLLEALSAPFKQILANSEIEATQTEFEQVIEKWSKTLGYNAKENTWENLIDAGVIEPAKVIRSAIENASSVAKMFCATEVLFAENGESSLQNLRVE